MNRTLAAVFTLTFTAASYALPTDPAVSRTQIAFVEGGQIWVVPRRGGAPRRVTDTAGNKVTPRFSPAGTTLAYSSNEAQGEVNLFTVPVRGGTPSRITFMNSHQVLSQWTGAGELVFHTNALSFSRIEMQLYTVPARGGLPTPLPPTYGAEGALDDSGRWLAYTPQWPNPLIANWKRYRGGAAPDLWLVDLRGGTSEKITDWIGTDRHPMWDGAMLYYVSDQGAEEKRNLWSYDMRTRTRRQVTHFRDYDVRNPSIGAGAIVFELGPDLHLLDLRTQKSSRVNIRSVEPSLDREVDASRFITGRQVANGGEVSLFEARGDLWLARAGSPPRNLTATSGVFEREAALSPDGNSIAYWSDATGEYQLYVRGTSDGVVPAPLTEFTEGFYRRLVWSPDGGRLGFAAQSGAIFVFDLRERRLEQIDTEPTAEPPELAWSPDSSWLAYTKSAPNRLGVIWRYDVGTGSRQQLTTETFNASTPVFDAAGKHLFFISWRNFENRVWDWLQQRVAQRSLTTLMAVPLRDNAFDVATMEGKALRLATSTGGIGSLAVSDEGDPIYVHTDLSGARSIRIVDLDEKKERVLIDAASEFSLSGDGRHMLITRDGKPFVRRMSDASERPVDLSGMSVRIDLRAEWLQIFDDVWRSYRDFFYAPKVKQPDWNVVRTRYRAMLERCVTRQEVNYVLADMIGESSTGHAYVANGGDVPSAPPGTVGMPGADFILEDGAFRITRIYDGAPWDDTARSPLREAREGEYLLAVEGKPLDPSRDVRAAFVGLAGKATKVTVGLHPRVDDEAREITIVPLSNEFDIRRRSWIETNRQHVLARSGGRAGYIHIPDFNVNGLSEFLKQYWGQIQKDALIVDARWSLGGSIGAAVAEILARPPLNYAGSRFSDAPMPSAHHGPKAVVVNHITVSAGENFAYYVRKLGVAPLIGSRTWGGLTGLNPVPSLIDGGSVNVPNAPFYDETGWLIEGPGLDPEVVVERDPLLPGDAALDAAIRVVTEAAEAKPYRPPLQPKER